MVAKRCLAGHTLEEPGDRVHRLVHRSHPHQGLERGGLGEPTPDGDGQVLIQGSDCQNTTFLRFQGAILTAGVPSFG